MAEVRLYFYDLEADALPDVCMKCGAPAVTRQHMLFTRLIKVRCVLMPLCHRHNNPLRWSCVAGLVFFAGFLLLIGASIASFLFAAGEGVGPERAGVYYGQWFLFATFAWFIFFLMVSVVRNLNAVRVLEIPDASITLSRVSDEFIWAYRDQTRGPGADVERAARERWDRRTDPADGDGPRRLPTDESFEKQ